MALLVRCLGCDEWRDDKSFRGPYGKWRHRTKHCRICLDPPNREARSARMLRIPQKAQEKHGRS